MLAAPEAADWAEHPAARAGKLEKRGRLSHWPASDGARQASWPRMQAPAKSANLSKFGASMRARVQVSYAALADIRGRRRCEAPGQVGPCGAPVGVLRARMPRVEVLVARVRELVVLILVVRHRLAMCLLRRWGGRDSASH